MSGGWGTPGLDREVFFCVEDGCPFPAHTTRPVVEPWLHEGGVIGPDDAVEWVCDDHITPL